MIRIAAVIAVIAWATAAHACTSAPADGNKGYLYGCKMVSKHPVEQ